MHFFIWLGTHAPWWWAKLRVWGMLFAIAVMVAGCDRKENPLAATDRPLTSADRPGGIGLRSQSCTLTTSGRIQITSNNQVVEYKDITVTGDSAAIWDFTGHSGVTIRNCKIRHDGHHAIEISSSPNLTIDGCQIICTTTGTPGDTLSTIQNNIQLYACDDVYIHFCELRGGSSGAYLQSCDDAIIDTIEARNARGPNPRGQFIQLNDSHNARVSNVWGLNTIGSSRCTDNISFFQSNACSLRNSVLKGNDCPTGVGVMFEGDTSGVCINVDTINMANGSFSAYTNTSCVEFTNTRDYGHICSDQGRGAPSSGGRIWVIGGHSTACFVSGNKYWPAMGGSCAGPYWKSSDSGFCLAGPCTTYTNTSFTPAPIKNLLFCWEPSGPAIITEQEGP